MILINVYTAILINTFGEETIKVKQKLKRWRTANLDYPNILGSLFRKFHPIIRKKLMPIIKESKLILSYLAKFFITQSSMTENQKISPIKKINPANKLIIIHNSGENKANIKEVNFSITNNTLPSKIRNPSTDFYDECITKKETIENNHTIENEFMSNLPS